MSDAIEPTGGDTPEGRRQRGLRRRTSFALGLVVGLVAGVLAAIVLPGLLPEGQLDCTRPTTVLWEQTDDGGVSLEVDFDGDGTDACDANVVFSEAPTP